MKKTVITILTLAALAACGGQNQNTSASAPMASSVATVTAPAEGANVSVITARGQVNVPQNPERIAVYDFGAADTLTALGVPVGASVGQTGLDYLKPTIEKAKNVGTLFEPDFEALNAYQPQLIITGSRINRGDAFGKLEQLAPTIEMTVDVKNTLASAKERLDAYGKIFNKTAEADKLKADLDAAFAAAQIAAKDKGKGLVLIVNGGKLSAYGADSRLGGWLHKDIGLPVVDPNIKEGSHGQPISFEYIKQMNPDWLFVLDRSAAIGEEGAAAKDVLNNPLVAETTAWKKGQVVYMHPSAYLAAGGVEQLRIAVKQATDAFNAAK